MTYREYYQAQEEEQLYYNEIAILKSGRQHIIEACNPTLWKWGDVKWTQDTLTGSLTFHDVLKIVQFEAQKINENSDCVLVLQYFHTISEKIAEITKAENKAMATNISPKEKAAMEAVGGFERFGTYPQTLSMVGVVAPSVLEVEALEYGYVFQAMVYKHVEGQYQKLLYKQ